MHKELITKSEMKLIGLSVRTNNQNEMNPQAAKIGQLVAQYNMHEIVNQIPHRKSPGVTLAVYTDYASNEHGDYTFFIGEEVTDFADMPAELQSLTIPAATYQKFTTPEGSMPEVVIKAWQKIWQMTPNDLGGERAYIADFEVYDQRVLSSANLSLDIYIGIK